MDNLTGFNANKQDKAIIKPVRFIHGEDKV